MAEDQFQYVKLPDGSYGKFPANATDAQIRAQLAKNFPTAPTQTAPTQTAPAQTAPTQTAPAIAPKAPADDFKLMSEKPPENARFPGLGKTGYDIVDILAKATPGVGSITGSVLAAPGGPVSAAAGAGLGAAAGDRLERMIQDWLYKDLPPETASQALQSMGLQAGFGAFSEGQAQVVNAFAKPMVENMGIAGQLLKEAKAGRGIRLTPGEAGGSSMLKLSESVLEHWPGGAGQMEKFRAGQEADVQRTFAKLLDDIGKRHLTPEQAGAEIQAAIQKTKGQLDPMLQQGLEQVQTRQAQNVTGLFDKRLQALSPEAMAPEDLGQAIQANVRAGRTEAEAATQAQLGRVRAEQQQNVNQLFSGEIDALSPQAATSQEAGAAVQKRLVDQKAQSDQTLQQSVDAVRTGQANDVQQVLQQQLTTLSPQAATSQEAGAAVQKRLVDQKAQADQTLQQSVDAVRTGQAKDVEKVLQQQLTTLSPEQLTSEQAGLQVQGVVREAQTQSEQTVGLKFDEVRRLLGKKPGDFLSPAEFDAAVAEHPEAKAKLEEARLLYQQELERFSPAILQKILKSGRPEDIGDVMAKAGLEDLRTLNQFLPAKVQKAAARELLDGMIYRATDPRSGVVSAQSLSQSLKQLGEERGRLLFGAQYDAILQDATRTIDGINTAADATAERMTQQANAPYQPELVQKILKTGKPEDIAGMMETAGIGDLYALQHALPPGTQQAASRALLENMIGRARDPRSGVVSAQSLSQSLKQLGEERGRLLFGAQYDAILQDATRTIDGINTAADATAERLTQQANAPYQPELVQKILKTGKPEDIAGMMETAGIGDLYALQHALPPETQQAASRALLENMIDRARDPQTGIIDGKKLAKSLRDLGPERGQIIFADRYPSIMAAGQQFNQINMRAETQASQLQQGNTKFTQELFRNILGTSKPEQVAGRVQTAGLGELRELMTALPPNLQQGLRRNVLENILNRARDPQTGVIDAKKYARFVHELGADRGRILFGDQYQNVIHSGEVLGKINAAAATQTERLTSRSTAFNKDLIQQVIKTNNPELIAGYFRKAGPEELREFLRSVPPETRQAASRNVLEDMLQPARDIQSQELDPARLAESLSNGLKQLGPSRGRILFGDQYENVVGASKLLDRIAFTDSPVIGKMHMASFMSGLMGLATAGGALLAGPARAAELAVPGYLGPKLLAWMLTNPQYSGRVFNGLRLLATGAMKAEPLAANEIFGTSPATYPDPEAMHP